MCYAHALILALATAATEAEVTDDGVVLIEADASMLLSVPEGFLDSSSPAISQWVDLEGVKLESRGAYELGTATVAIAHFEKRFIPQSIGESRGVLMEVEGLEFLAKNAIEVGAKEWDVQLAATSGIEGVCLYSRDSASAGSVQIEIDVDLVATLSSTGDTRFLPLGPLSIVLSGTWFVSPETDHYKASLGGDLGDIVVEAAFTGPALIINCQAPVVDTSRPGPRFLDPSSDIHEDVASLGRGCIVGTNCSVGRGVVIGPHSVVSRQVAISADATLGESVTVGAGVYIGPGVMVGSGTVIGSGCRLEAGATVANDCVLEPGSIVGAHARIRSNVTLGEGSVVGEGAFVSNDALVGSNAQVADEVRIAERAVLLANNLYSSDIYGGIGADGKWYHGEQGQDWGNTGPLYIFDIDSEDEGIGVSQYPHPQEFTESFRWKLEEEPPGGEQPDFDEVLQQLREDVGNDIASPNCGGTGFVWGEGERFCAWFAEELRRKLEGLGYSTTFTSIRQVNPYYRWWRIGVDKTTRRHNITDVHWPDGSMVFIEAQGNGNPDAPEDSCVGQPHARVDGNNDGKVTYWNGRYCLKPTDGDQIICVYGSRAEARAAGDPMAGREND